MAFFAGPHSCVVGRSLRAGCGLADCGGAGILSVWRLAAAPSVPAEVYVVRLNVCGSARPLY